MSDDIKAVVDERSAKLMQEFYDHFTRCRATNPKITQDQAYQGWALQKISALQVSVEKCIAAIEQLQYTVRQ